MSRQSRRFQARIVEIDGFRIYAGPCKKAPSSVEPWIDQFCSQKTNSWYVKVDPDYAGDWFNQYGLNQIYSEFDFAVELITDNHSSEWSSLSDDQISTILFQAQRLYGQIHARWILQPRGLALMKEKYESGVFGTCLRHACHGAKLLPMGTTLIPRRHSAKLYCPCCCDIYRSFDGVAIDGAHFGPAFPHMFLSEYSKYDLSKQFQPFELEAFGFKVHRNQCDPYPPHSSNRYEVEYPENPTD